jgi:hypothetical protein
MSVKTTKRRAIHLVPENTNEALCGSHEPAGAIDVVMPWDVPSACAACLDEQKARMADAKRSPRTLAPRPSLF